MRKSKLLRTIIGRVLPPCTPPPLFRESILKDAVLSYKDETGKLISKVKSKVVQVNTLSDVSFIDVNVVDTDYSIEAQKRLGVSFNAPVQPYFKYNLDSMSSLEDSSYLFAQSAEPQSTEPQSTEPQSTEPQITE